jgi:hypothetical protein
MKKPKKENKMFEVIIAAVLFIAFVIVAEESPKQRNKRR